MSAELISPWPGKMITGRAHPALLHMLDVGAVASCLLGRRPQTDGRTGDRAAGAGWRMTADGSC